MAATEQTIDIDEVRDLAAGAGVLSAGGGSYPHLEALIVERLYRAGRRATLIDAADLADDDLVASPAMMGAPLVMLERLADPKQFVRAVQALNRHVGRDFSAVMPFEIGSLNSMVPLMVSALMDLPVVDADAIGRSFPEAHMTSFAMHGLDLCPFAIIDIRDNDIILTRTASALWTERLGRVVTTELGSMAAICPAPRTGREIRGCAVLGTVTRAIRLGRAMHAAQQSHDDPVGRVIDVERGRLLLKGKVIDVDRRTTGGFVRGEALLSGSDEFDGRTLRVDFQNEYTIAWVDGHPTTMVPDLICILDDTTGYPIGTEALRYGLRVSVVSLPAPAIWTSQAGLAMVGPKAFGYDLDYVPSHGLAEAELPGVS